MISPRHASVQRLLMALGTLGRPHDQQFRTPDLDAGRALLAASSVFLLLVLASASGHSGLGSIVLALLLLAGVLVFQTAAGRVLTLALLGVLLVLLFAVPAAGILMLLLTCLLAVACGRYLWRHAASVHLNAQLRRLRSALGEGWKAYLPGDLPAQHHARVLVSPDGQTMYLGIVPGKAELKYGTPHVTWGGLTADGLLELSRRDAGVVQQGQRVLWVTKPPQAEGDYTTVAEQGVSTVIGTETELAAQLQAWSTMRANLQDAPAVTPSEQGRKVEAQAVIDVETLLPDGWSMRAGILLAQGGDSDLELTMPGGERYVIDIKSRNDRMDLAAPKGDRSKSWPEIHAQVSQAARQLKGVPVVWQPLAQDEDFYLIGEVWCLRGDAQVLLDALSTLGVSETTANASPHEILGVPVNAGREEIQAAYKRLAKQYHPDRVASLGEEFRQLAERRMKAINAAYQALMR